MKNSEIVRYLQNITIKIISALFYESGAKIGEVFILEYLRIVENEKS